MINEPGGFFSHSSTRLTGEELSSRRRRTVMIMGGVLCVLLLLGAAAASYPRLREARLFSMAHRFADRSDLHNAELSYRQILAANPRQVQAARELADLLQRMGLPDSLAMRRRVVELEPGYLKNSADWIYGALGFGKLLEAEEALFLVEDAGRKTGLYHHLASTLARQWDQRSRALSNAVDAVRIDAANESFQLNLGSLQALSTNEMVHGDGLRRLEKLASASSFRVPALNGLLRAAEARGELGQAVAFAERLAAASSLDSDRRRHGELLLKHDPQAFEKWLETRLALVKADSPEFSGTALWLAGLPASSAAGKWVSVLPESASANWEIHLLKARAAMAGNDWSRAASELRPPWNTNDFLRASLSAEVEGRLDTTKAGQVREAWSKAVSASDAETLLRFLPPESASAFLETALTNPPTARWATTAALTRAALAGDTRRILELSRKRAALDPDDDLVRNSVNSLCLLLGDDVKQAQSSSDRLFARHPGDPAFAITQAVSLYLQDRRLDAIKTLRLLPEFHHNLPPVAFWLGVIHAAERQYDRAAFYLDLVDGVQMMPEQRAMVEKAWKLVEEGRALERSRRR